MKKLTIIIFIIIIIFILLWITEMIPKTIGIISAKNYMDNHYNHMNFKYKSIKSSELYDGYDVLFFYNYNDYPHKIIVYPKYFPIKVYESYNIKLN